MTSKWTNVVFIILIAAVSILVYYNTIRTGFVGDDVPLISSQTDFLKDWGNLKTVWDKPFPAETYEPIPFYRPLITLVNFINYHFSQKAAHGYHQVNVGFHTANVILLYLLIFLIFKNELLSLFTSLFFAAHSIHVNSVVWISGRTDVIACFFLLLTAILFVKRKDHRGVPRILLFAGSIIAFILALFSKEIAFVLPLFLFVWDWLSEEGKLKRKILPYLPFALVTILYLIWRVSVLGNLGTGKSYTTANVFQRFLTLFPIYFYYFKKFTFPIFLNFSPRVLTVTTIFSLKFWGALVFFAVILALGRTLRKTVKPVSFGIFWILVTLIPVLNLVPLYASVKEWWGYIPSIGFCLILGQVAVWGISWDKSWFDIRLPHRKPKGEIAIETEPSASMAAATPEGGAIPDSPEASVGGGSESAPKKSFHFPGKIVIKAGYAVALLFALILIFYAFTIKSRGRIFRNDYHLWTNTTQTAPYDAVAQNAIGVILKRKNVPRWAKMAFRRAVEADSNYAEGRNNFGSSLEMSNQEDSALVQIKAAIRLDPGFVDAYNNLGIVYGKKMEYDSAIIAFQRAVQLDSTYYLASKNLGLVYEDMENFPKALEYLEKALRFAPNLDEVNAIKKEISQIRVRGY
ncbi:MAG: tetratricopeptide repeat protein [Candidatus Zixiibacteriota bacterium]